MSKYGSYQDEGGFERADNGEYLVVLTAIDEAQKPSFNDPSIQDDVWQWKFETVDVKDSEGRPYMFMKTTKRKYGHEKASLTILIDSLFATHFVKDDWELIDVDKLVGKKFKAMVTLERNVETGKQYNNIQSVYRPKGSPVKLSDVIGDDAKARAAAAPAGRDDAPGAKVDEDLSDPFE